MAYHTFLIFGILYLTFFSEYMSFDENIQWCPWLHKDSKITPGTKQKKKNLIYFEVEFFLEEQGIGANL